MQLTHQEKGHLLRCLSEAAKRFEKDIHEALKLNSSSSPETKQAVAQMSRDEAILTLYLIAKIQAEPAVAEPQPVLQPCGAYHTDEAPCNLCRRHYEHL